MQSEERKRDPIGLAANIIIVSWILVGGFVVFTYLAGDVWKMVSLYTFYGLLCSLGVIIVGCAAKVKHWRKKREF